MPTTCTLFFAFMCFMHRVCLTLIIFIILQSIVECICRTITSMSISDILFKHLYFAFPYDSKQLTVVVKTFLAKTVAN